MHRHSGSSSPLLYATLQYTRVRSGHQLDHPREPQLCPLPDMQRPALPELRAAKRTLPPASAAACIPRTARSCPRVAPYCRVQASLPPAGASSAAHRHPARLLPSAAKTSSLAGLLEASAGHAGHPIDCPSPSQDGHTSSLHQQPAKHLPGASTGHPQGHYKTLTTCRAPIA
jgi:hypothetical protein